MLDIAIKLLSEQALSSKPALERPIIHVKYGVMGAVVAGASMAAAAIALSAGLFFWLTDEGLSLSVACVVISVFLAFLAIVGWLVCSYLMKKALVRSEQESRQQEQGRNPPSVQEQLLALAASASSELLQAFIEGIKSKEPETPEHPASSNGFSEQAYKATTVPPNAQAE